MPLRRGACVFAFYGKRERKREINLQAVKPISSLSCSVIFRPSSGLMSLTPTKYIRTEKMPVHCTHFFIERSQFAPNTPKTPIFRLIPTNIIIGKIRINCISFPAIDSKVCLRPHTPHHGAHRPTGDHEQ